MAYDKKKLSAWTESQVKSDETGKLHKGYDNDHPVGVFLCLYECERTSGR